MKDWATVLTVCLQKKSAVSVDPAKLSSQPEVTEKFWLKLIKSGVCKAIILMYLCLEVFNLPAKFRRNLHTFHKTNEGMVVSGPFMGK